MSAYSTLFDIDNGLSHLAHAHSSVLLDEVFVKINGEDITYGVQLVRMVRC